MKKEFQYNSLDVKIPTAVLVAVTTQRQSPTKTKEYLAELAFLASTLGIKTVKMFNQNLERPDTKYYVGKGKMEEINAYIKAKDIDMVIFDDELTSGQVRNLDSIIKDVMVIDRSLLILQIFAKRAQTAQAKTQVELAQYQYMLPRLTNLWTHHSRQKGGVGMKGPGETELETDKRIIKDKIVLLKERLAKIEKQSTLRRKSREREVRVALVGYTNVGKSTLMRLLSKADVFAENKLFATVDSTVRRVVMHNIPFLLTDTVGFIRKLPTTLIESFKSTLDEIVEADILLHVVDISHDGFQEQIDVVNNILTEIGATNKKVVMIFNKTDQFIEKEFPPFEDHPPGTVEGWKQLYSMRPEKHIFISALKKENITELRKIVFAEISEVYYDIYPNHERYDVNKFWLEPEK